MKPADLLKTTENKLRLYQDELQQLEGIASEHGYNSFISWVSGVVAPITKSLADAGINVIEKFTGAAGSTVSEGYNILQHGVKISQTNDMAEAFTATAKIGETVDPANISADGFHLVNAYKAFNNGQPSVAFSELLEIPKNSIAADIVRNGLNVGNAMNVANENNHAVFMETNRMQNMISNRRNFLQQKIIEEQTKLQQMQAGIFPGGDVGIKNTRQVSAENIPDLLNGIDANIQQLKSNITR